MNAAEAFAAHGGAMTFEEMASGALLLEVSFASGSVAASESRGGHVG